MKKIFITILLSLILLTGCNSKEMTNSIKFKKDYEQYNDTYNKNGKKIRNIVIPDNNPFVYKEVSDIIEMIKEKQTFVVYFGFAECPWCRSVLPSVIEASSNINLERIYYVDIKDIRDVIELDNNGNAVTTKEASQEYYELLSLLNDVLEDYILTDQNGNKVKTGEKRIYAPNFVAIVDGKAEQMDTCVSDSQDNSYQELSDEMIKETSDKFKCLAKCIIGNTNTCPLDGAC